MVQQCLRPAFSFLFISGAFLLEGMIYGPGDKVLPVSSQPQPNLPWVFLIVAVLAPVCVSKVSFGLYRPLVLQAETNLPVRYRVILPSPSRVRHSLGK